ncbi:hypothetical protein MKX01_033832 [Papaver californicum]|nr:hypothetical protein MKX01_033832 [Papaver californicum]
MKSFLSFNVVLVLVLLASILISLGVEAQTCKPSECKTDFDAECCKPGTYYITYNGDGGGPTTCDNRYHPNNTPVLALSTGCVMAKVVDECDSAMGCDKEHAYQPPYRNNIVDASPAVWKALGVPREKWGNLDITWSDA